MDHTPQDRQIPGEPSPAADADRGDQPPAPGTSSTAPTGCPPGECSIGLLRWARCPDDGRLHLLEPAEVVVAATGGHAQALCGRPLSAEGLTLTNGSSGALCITCVDDIPSPSNDPGPHGHPVSSPVTDGPPVISADAAARALQKYFLANADRGDDDANDELVAEMLHRIRAQRASREGGR